MHRILSTSAYAFLIAAPALADPLPSWNDTNSKTQIIDFVDSVTDSTADSFVPVADRIAVFDNDGTLISEHPIYFQAAYAFDRLREKAADDPSILNSDVLKAANDGDMQGVMAGGMEGLSSVIDVSHSGISIDDFQADARDWLESAQHPVSGLNYGAMTFQPMVELLTYLRDEGFTVYIVTAGGVDFVRSFALDAYNVPPNLVVGSQGNAEYQIGEDGTPVVMKSGGVYFVDDKAAKPVGIMRTIGKRPILAGGNSDGDFQMLEWTTAGEGPSLGLLIHHTDSEREFAYDRDTPIGKLSEGLDQAADRNWLLVDMARDWGTVWTGGK
ncbi:HAD family hydrolase [Paracoccus sp. Z330]|uniref:HAD family hydrolase n=1 Tax=Paracoccus onchidii TaxID=3017813 RepID=A0ABT4ZLF9_9RHOB|nr:HAD family hydrolase [Paracoccus onchidii]MDB6179596.1 HAD family hydrolase [Paracoccus onchidii]